MLAMFVDHTGLLFFPDLPAFRAVGRLAMPLFAYGVAAGYRRTQAHGTTRQYLLRMALLGLFSQFPYTFLHAQVRTPPNLNICFSWTAALCLLCVMDGPYHYLVKTAVLTLAASAATMLANQIDYAFLAIGLVLAYAAGHRSGRGWAAPTAAAVLILLYSAAYHTPLQLWSLLALPLIAFSEQGTGAVWNEKLRVPKRMGYLFYPAHMAVLGIIRAMVQ